MAATEGDSVQTDAYVPPPTMKIVVADLSCSMSLFTGLLSGLWSVLSGNLTTRSKATQWLLCSCNHPTQLTGSLQDMEAQYLDAVQDMGHDTLVYPAIIRAVELIEQALARTPDLQVKLLVMTDGEDNSDTRASEVLAALRRLPAHVMGRVLLLGLDHTGKAVHYLQNLLDMFRDLSYADRTTGVRVSTADQTAVLRALGVAGHAMGTRPSATMTEKDLSSGYVELDALPITPLPASALVDTSDFTAVLLERVRTKLQPLTPDQRTLFLEQLGRFLTTLQARSELKGALFAMVACERARRGILPTRCTIPTVADGSIPVLFFVSPQHYRGPTVHVWNSILSCMQTLELVVRTPDRPFKKCGLRPYLCTEAGWLTKELTELQTALTELGLKALVNDAEPSAEGSHPVKRQARDVLAAPTALKRSRSA